MGKPPPYLATSFWSAVGRKDVARDQVHRHLRRYMNWIPTQYIDEMALSTGFAGSQDELLETLRAFAEIEADEVHLSNRR